MAIDKTVNEMTLHFFGWRNHLATLELIKNKFQRWNEQFHFDSFVLIKILSFELSSFLLEKTVFQYLAFTSGWIIADVSNLISFEHFSQKLLWNVNQPTFWWLTRQGLICTGLVLRTPPNETILIPSVTVLILSVVGSVH